MSITLRFDVGSQGMRNVNVNSRPISEEEDSERNLNFSSVPHDVLIIRELGFTLAIRRGTDKLVTCPQTRLFYSPLTPQGNVFPFHLHHLTRRR